MANLFSDEERVYAECQTCSSGWSGPESHIHDRADQHAIDNPGHRVVILVDEEHND